MDADAFAKVAAAIAWPITTILLVGAFREPIVALLMRLSQSLTFKNVKIRLFGTEFEATPERARTILDELLDDITESTNELTKEQIDLFDRILVSKGESTVNDLIPGFVRDGNAPELEHLRALRDQKLIQPAEGGRWRPEKHPVVTRYGQLVAKLRAQAKKVEALRASPGAG